MLNVPSPAGERREGVNASVSSDVQSVFKGKTYSQLQVIFQGIEGKIRAGGPNLDMGYWESLLQQLRAHMARARSVLPPASVGPRSRPQGASAHCPSWKAVPLGSGVGGRGQGPGRRAGPLRAWPPAAPGLRLARVSGHLGGPGGRLSPVSRPPHTLCVQILSMFGRAA